VDVGFVLVSAAFYDTKRELVPWTLATFMAYERDENDCSMINRWVLCRRSSDFCQHVVVSPYAMLFALIQQGRIAE
jgi:hypothetical protein